MLVMRNEGTPREGEWMEIEIWGTTIRVKVRPKTPKIEDAIRARFKGMKEGKAKDKAILEAMYDHLIEDIEGLGEEAADGSVSHVEINLDSKKKLLHMPVPSGEEAILVRVINKANELGFQVVEEQQKNS